MEILPQFLRELSEAFDGHAYLVGGCVRDKLLNCESKDIDIEVYGFDVLAIREKLQGMTHVSQVFECGRSFNVIKIQLIDGSDIDVTVPRREISTGSGHTDFKIISDPNMTILEASSRRDFTMNSIVESIETGQLIDHYDGMMDIEDNRLRAVGNSFLEDPLRVLRGMQFCGRFKMCVDEETAYLVALISGQVLNMSKERIWGEWEKLFLKAEKPSIGIKYLQDTGAIEIFPELAAMNELEQDPKYHPEGNVLEHVKKAMNYATTISYLAGLNDDDKIILMLSCLCHDMGKIKTTVIENGCIKSPGHAYAGDEIIQTFMESIGTPKKYHDAILTLCRHHMDLLNVRMTRRFVRRLANKVNVHSNLTMLQHLIVCDHMGRGPGSVFPCVVFNLDDIAKDLKVEIDVPKPIMQGRDLIALGLKPGPEFKRILDDVFERQLDGDIDSLESAISYVKDSFIEMS